MKTENSNANRLYLFDIDGTLITSGGAGGSAMRSAFAALWRIEDGFKGVEFSGRTDRALFREAFGAAGMSEDAFDHGLQRFKRAYYRRLHHTLRHHEGRVLPGVVEVLKTLSQDDHATVALGTGNFRFSAGIKLGYYGIAGYFSCGGFGDQTEDRATLIGGGIRAAERSAGRRHETVFVIGDTVHDMRAAKANGAVAVGVRTGNVPADVLSAAGADVVIETLESAAGVLFRPD